MQPKSTNVPRSKIPAWGALVLFLVILGINAGFTQYFAERLQDQSALSQPFSGQFYQPFSWIEWSFRSYDRRKPMWDTAYFLAFGLIASTFLVYALIIGFFSRRTQKHEGIHGTAHWASEIEIRKTGLLPSKRKPGKGVYVGAWEDKHGKIRYLRHDGPEHIAAIAPTRSGKGVGLVIPTLLSWPHSAVIHDMKGELWDHTAGWRKTVAKNKVLKFDPAAESGSCRFNPLQEIRLGTKFEVADVQNLVTIIVDPDGKGMSGADAHWKQTAHAFLTGVTLHLLYMARAENEKRLKENPTAAMKTACLADIAFALSDPTRPVDALYDEMLNTAHIIDESNNETPKKKIPHPVVAASARDMKNRPEQERGSVLSTAMSYLSLYRDPLVKQNTETSDFTIKDLMHHEDPVSLYLVVSPTDKDRLKPLMRLIVNQIVRVLCRDGMKGYEHRLLLMLDEFPSLGRLDVFQEALAFIAGYGIKAYLIMQDISQLRAAYGLEESILSNCHIRVAYAPNKIETGKWLSEMLGTTTVTVPDTTISGHRFGAVLQNVNQSMHSIARPLMTPDECMNNLPKPLQKEGSDEIVKPGNMLIFSAGSAPIYGTQILFFKDPEFSARAKITAPEETDRLSVLVNTFPKHHIQPKAG